MLGSVPLLRSYYSLYSQYMQAGDPFPIFLGPNAQACDLSAKCQRVMRREVGGF